MIPQEATVYKLTQGLANLEQFSFRMLEVLKTCIIANDRLLKDMVIVFATLSFIGVVMAFNLILTLYLLRRK